MNFFLHFLIEINLNKHANVMSSYIKCDIH